MSRTLAAIAGAYVGRRLELAPHREEWARGDRYGTVLRVTMLGFVVKLERSGRIIQHIGDSDIGQYLD